MDSELDVTPYSLTNNNSSQLETIRVNFNPYAMYYNMGRKKYLHIFNHYEFDHTEEFGFKPETRTGTDADVRRLEEVFKLLGFEVKTYDDLTYKDIEDKMKTDVIGPDHTNNTSCICIAILTHGDDGGVLYAKDRPYTLKTLTKMFEDKKLVTIPKLFFIQACRGKKIDEGYLVQYDGAGPSSPRIVHVPTHIDFLIVHSAVDGYTSFREADGTWMIQTLCNVIELYHNECDLLTMITYVNHIVAIEYTSYNENIAEYDRKKQTVETRFTLTKLLKF